MEALDNVITAGGANGVCHPSIVRSNPVLQVSAALSSALQHRSRRSFEVRRRTYPGSCAVLHGTRSASPAESFDTPTAGPSMAASAGSRLNRSLQRLGWHRDNRAPLHDHVHQTRSRKESRCRSEPTTKPTRSTASRTLSPSSRPTPLSTTRTCNKLPGVFRAMFWEGRDVEPRQGPQGLLPEEGG